MSWIWGENMSNSNRRAENREVFELGRKAYEEGRHIQTIPSSYIGTTLRQHWEQGYNTAQNAFERNERESKVLIDVTSDHVVTLLEAYDFGQFSDDFNQPLAPPLKVAIRALLDELNGVEND